MKRYSWLVVAALMGTQAGFAADHGLKDAANTDIVIVHAEAKPLKTFVPSHAFGAGIDGSETGATEAMTRPNNAAVMRSMGYRSLSYRLRTELGVEAWHWNPAGTWSDPSRRSGYWTSSAAPETGPIHVGWGYRLPRRGSTIDQANNDGYSRIDDGDPATYWKSNPYLDSYYTHERNDRHPQWIVIDLGQNRPVDTIKLQWAIPYATKYRIQYAVFPWDVPILSSESAFEAAIDWRAFPNTAALTGHGGSVVHNLTSKPITARFVRVWMTESSESGPKTSHDVRDRLGYAVSELSLGHRRPDGSFEDWITHNKTNGQTKIYVSSTDPWHTDADRDPHTEQPGFDAVAASGLTNNLPMVTPVSVLYGTPENAAAELRYLRARHIPVTDLELSEEPDGQYITPEDYGALYIQWANALRKVDPTIRLGGPGFQTAVKGWVHWRDENGDMSWFRRFLAYLTSHGHSADFQFFSLEWYPFDDIKRSAADQVADHVRLFDSAFGKLRREGLPANVPWMIGEYGYSSYTTQDEVTIPAALINAEIVARFLTLGGDQCFLYGYEPGELSLEKTRIGATWGNLIALLADDDGNAAYKLPTYWTARLVSQMWAEEDAPNKPHQLYRANVERADGAEDALLAAYPLHRPDGKWSVLLINKSPTAAKSVRIALVSGEGRKFMKAPLEVIRYGAEQYAWKADGVHGHPLRSLPPSVQTVKPAAAGPPMTVTVPAFSLCVVRGD